MFSFALPKFAALHVNLPTGGSTLLVHAGDGRFLSKVPPIILAGVAPGEQQDMPTQPMGWDGDTLPGDGQANPVVFAFDVKTAAAAVEAAAAAGDTFAQAVVAEMQAAERQIAAQQKLVGNVAAAAPAVNDAKFES